MDDLISRQAAIDACMRVRDLRAYDEIEEIQALPSAQPEHGRWIYYEDETIEDGGRCSVCGGEMPAKWSDHAWRYVETDYCPSCGALMDEEADNDDHL